MPTNKEESEFENRDPQGLEKSKKDDDFDEDKAVAKAERFYKNMLFLQVPMIAGGLAWGTYLALAYGLGQKAKLDAKFLLLKSHDLGWVYLSVWITQQARSRLMVNANARRAGARVGRPDQHAYKVMDPKAKSDAPLVLMANSGALGRFNRAQRGIFNTDEAAPLFLASTLLAGFVFGPVVPGLSALAAYGRVKFGLGYAESGAGRMAGFMPAMIAEGWMSGLVGLIAIKTLAGDRIPF